MATITVTEPLKGAKEGKSDWINVGLIILACVSAHAFPWQTLILSYAVFGPAHYLTEISWLHDRQYFARGRWFLPCSSALAAFLTIVAFVPGAPSAWLACGLLLVSLFAAICAVAGWSKAMLIASTTIAILATTRNHLPAIALAIAVLLPTVVHVFVFTTVFMMQGARRSASVPGHLAVGALMLATATFVAPIVPVMRAEGVDAGGAATYFQPIVDEFGRLGFHPSVMGRIVGFLAFAYAYHFLNWFGKAEIIRWHKVPPIRLVMMLYLWAAILVTYWINFAFGFMVSLLLSNLHVLLEFPLNIRAFAGLTARPVQNASSLAGAKHKAQER
jgi:hypothetical protein